MLGLSVLAVISTVFGMLMAVASDLPSLDSKAQFRAAENSVLYARGPECRSLEGGGCQRIAKLTGNLNRILVNEGEVSPNLKNAVIAIEDRRFYTHQGVDYTGIARALSQDVLRRRAAQGGSTITQQFVKNALSAQGDRSVFQKLREAALAYHLERKWSKEKILTQYLNTVYFGNGAYGVEAAARTYFGDGDEPEERANATKDTPGVTVAPTTTTPDENQDPDVRESRVLSPAEAALLAGMISSPSMYDPIEHPGRGAHPPRPGPVAHARPEDDHAARSTTTRVKQAVPDEDQVDPPDVESDQPYFTSWVTGQLLDRYNPAQIFSGGMQIHTTIDPELQAAAEQAIAGRLAGVGPSASLVAIDNDTGEVRAMVGGTDFNARPFNLATNGHRQPGSAIKPFILVRALEDGVDPNSTWASQQKIFPVPNSPGEKFVGQELRGLLPGLGLALVGHRRLGQLRLRRARAQDRHEADRPAGAPHGHPHQAVDQPRDDARRPRGGRHAARDGLCLLDDRQRGRAHLELVRPATPARSASTRSSGTRRRREERGHATCACSRRRSAPSPRRCCTWSSRAAPARRRRSGTSTSGARPARPRTTATPGSSAATTT